MQDSEQEQESDRFIRYSISEDPKHLKRKHALEALTLSNVISKFQKFSTSSEDNIRILKRSELSEALKQYLKISD